MDFERFKGKKVLISGGGGFIGRNLGKRLVSYGADVFLVSNYFSEWVDEIRNKVKMFEIDINSKEFLEFLGDADYLFHLAWQTELKKSMENPLKDLESDIGGLLRILEKCKNNKNIKIIFPSAVTIFGLVKELPVNESRKENPLSIYETNKLMAEKYLQMYYQIYGLKSCILRLSNVYGEGQRIDNPNRGVLNYMIGRALGGKNLTVYGEGDFIRDYCYIDNYIDAFVLAALSERTNGEMYVLGSGQGKTFLEVVQEIKKIVGELNGGEVVIEKVPFPDSENKINERDFIADFSKFREDTGWSPKVSFEEGLKRTIGFYVEKLNAECVKK